MEQQRLRLLRSDNGRHNADTSSKGHQPHRARSWHLPTLSPSPSPSSNSKSGLPDYLSGAPSPTPASQAGSPPPNFHSLQSPSPSKSRTLASSSTPLLPSTSKQPVHSPSPLRALRSDGSHLSEEYKSQQPLPQLHANETRYPLGSSARQPKQTMRHRRRSLAELSTSADPNSSLEDCKHTQAGAAKTLDAKYLQLRVATDCDSNLPAKMTGLMGGDPNRPRRRSRRNSLPISLSPMHPDLSSPGPAPTPSHPLRSSDTLMPSLLPLVSSSAADSPPSPSPYGLNRYQRDLRKCLSGNHMNVARLEPDTYTLHKLEMESK